MHATEIFLVRHAQSRPRADLNHAEWPLSVVGQRQALDLIPVLSSLNLQAIYSSPYRRCVETITPFAQSSGLELQIQDDLRERLVAETVIDDFYAVWRRSWGDFDYALSGCESSREAQTRMVAAVEAICASHRGQRVAVSSHGYVIGLLAYHLDPGFGRAETEALRNPEILRVVVNTEAMRLDREFCCPGLDRLATDYEQTPYVDENGERRKSSFKP